MSPLPSSDKTVKLSMQGVRFPYMALGLCWDEWKTAHRQVKQKRRV